MDEAKKPDSAIRLQQVILEPEQIGEKTVTVVSQPQLASKLGLQPEQTTASTVVPKTAEPPVFATPEEQKVAQITYGVIRRLENQPLTLPSVSHLSKPEVQALVLHEVQAQYRPSQLEIAGVTQPPDLAAIVAKTRRKSPKCFVAINGKSPASSMPRCRNIIGKRPPATRQRFTRGVRN